MRDYVLAEWDADRDVTRAVMHARFPGSKPYATKILHRMIRCRIAIEALRAELAQSPPHPLTVLTAAAGSPLGGGAG